MFSRLSVLLLIMGMLFWTNPAVHARSAVTPWTSDQGFHNLVYGATTTSDVIRIMGAPPDDIVKNGQMYPVIENYYYYGDDQSGAATVFVFQNGFIAGLLYKSAGNSFIDLSYLLLDNGDRIINNEIMGGFRGYYPYYPNLLW